MNAVHQKPVDWEAVAEALRVVSWQIYPDTQQQSVVMEHLWGHVWSHDHDNYECDGGVSLVGEERLMAYGLYKNGRSLP